MSDTDELLALGQRWAEAEVAGDTATLAAMADPELRLIGPLGFVLDREAWLHRYDSGDLQTSQLIWDQVETRVFGDTAITVGRQSQQAGYRGRPNNVDLRVSHVFLRDSDAAYGWRIVHIQLSNTLSGPPPAAGGPE